MTIILRKASFLHSLSLAEGLIAEKDNDFIGWLRWNLFWDTPFMNMLYLQYGYRNRGYGKEMVAHWENLMKEKGYPLVMTSTLSSEAAQHFYRKLNYIDSVRCC